MSCDSVRFTLIKRVIIKVYPEPTIGTFEISLECEGLIWLCFCWSWCLCSKAKTEKLALWLRLSLHFKFGTRIETEWITLKLNLKPRMDNQIELLLDMGKSMIEYFFWINKIKLLWNEISQGHKVNVNNFRWREV